MDGGWGPEWIGGLCIAAGRGTWCYAAVRGQVREEQIWAPLHNALPALGQARGSARAGGNAGRCACCVASATQAGPRSGMAIQGGWGRELGADDTTGHRLDVPWESEGEQLGPSDVIKAILLSCPFVSSCTQSRVCADVPVLVPRTQLMPMHHRSGLQVYRPTCACNVRDICMPHWRSTALPWRPFSPASPCDQTPGR